MYVSKYVHVHIVLCYIHQYVDMYVCTCTCIIMYVGTFVYMCTYDWVEMLNISLFGDVMFTSYPKSMFGISIVIINDYVLSIYLRSDKV